MISNTLKKTQQLAIGILWILSIYSIMFKYNTEFHVQNKRGKLTKYNNLNITVHNITNIKNNLSFF